jgi:uncharacterized protein (DUF885 family)
MYMDNFQSIRNRCIFSVIKPVSSIALFVFSCAATQNGAAALTLASTQAESPASLSLNISQDVDAKLLDLMASEYAAKMQAAGAMPDGEGGWGEADRLPIADPASLARRLAGQQQRLDSLNALPPAALTAENRINAAVLRTMLEADLANGHFRTWEMPLNSDSNFWTYWDASSGLTTAEDYRRYISRMRDIPRYFDQQTANMRAGLARGFSVPRVTLQGRAQSIAAFITADAQSNAFYAAFRGMPSNIPAADQAHLRAEAQQAIQQSVIPAYRKLLTFLEKTYLPRTRSSLSVKHLPNGAEFYAAQIKEYTTLNLSADQIHQIGLSEVARIQAEMHQVMTDSGFAGSLPDFITFLRTDPQFTAKSADELMGVSAYVAKRVDGKLSEVIGHLPRRRFTIRPVPDALAPFYTAGRGGLEACWMNTHNLSSRPLYNIPALTLHECSPGHSLQAALAEEQGSSTPMLRRTAYFSGFGEGWGLYTEWLGVSMGIYRTPYEHFGRLSYEMWRAARLVIDTGIHQHGWTRDQAITYLADHTALSRHEVETEVDRYISWPGQALAYKLGEMTIRRLRSEAQTALGERFDQRKFHDLILSLGSVPLPVLEHRIHDYIASGGA